MDCQEAVNLYEFYILGALDADGRSLMYSHLETCDACSERLQQDRETMVRLLLFWKIATRTLWCGGVPGGFRHFIPIGGSHDNQGLCGYCFCRSF